MNIILPTYTFGTGRCALSYFVLYIGRFGDRISARGPVLVTMRSHCSRHNLDTFGLFCWLDKQRYSKGCDNGRLIITITSWGLSILRDMSEVYDVSGVVYTAFSGDISFYLSLFTSLQQQWLVQNQDFQDRLLCSYSKNKTTPVVLFHHTRRLGAYLSVNK